MSNQALSLLVQRETGIEAILHYTCRDRNVLCIQSDLLGAAAVGIRNLICITGDPPKMGNYPDATAVFDVDAIGLVNIVHNLNRGLDIGGNPIGLGTSFVIGVGANPGLTDLDEEIRRFEFKVQAGAEYAVTQPVFDIRLLENFLKRIEHCRIPVIAGIWPLVSVRNAEFMKNELRVSVPDSILERMARAQTPEAARAEGVAIAREMLTGGSSHGAGRRSAHRTDVTLRRWMFLKRWEPRVWCEQTDCPVSENLLFMPSKNRSGSPVWQLLIAQRKIFGRTCATAVSILGLSLAAWAQSSPAPTQAPPVITAHRLQKLAVTVTDETGLAVPSVLIQLQAPPPAAPLHCETDFAGRCEFTNLSPGAYQLSAEKAGYYALVQSSVQVETISNLISLSRASRKHGRW